MYTCYNHSTLVLSFKKADSVAIKGKNTAVQTYTMIDNKVEINTDSFQVGEYTIQFFNGDNVLAQEVLQVKQNLKYAPQDYNPVSLARQTLDAINAYLAGIATHQQKRIQVGDKSIEYSTYDELLKWKNYYEMQVRKQQGKACNLRHQKLYYKGI